MSRLPGTVEDLGGRRAARWIRESTPGQFDRYGPEAQADLQDRAIARLGLTDSGLAWRAAHSGRTVYRSAEMVAMLGAAQRGDFEVLLVGYVSRWQRNLRRTLELLEDTVAEGHRTLIFSQFTQYLAKARSRLDGAGISYSYLDGKTRNRARTIADFKNGDTSVFLISLKAGGFGLNLTEADYVILLDPWWNPATEAQAVDRVHRIGQTKNVMVYRLVSKDTIEEKVMALKATKARLFESVMTDSAAGGTGFTAADIRELLA
jgi:superfamily II DNA or RNA helicase